MMDLYIAWDKVEQNRTNGEVTMGFKDGIFFTNIPKKKAIPLGVSHFTALSKNHK
jgi:hypothetical protein